jgi:hypothetical protein
VDEARHGLPAERLHVGHDGGHQDPNIPLWGGEEKGMVSIKSTLHSPMFPLLPHSSTPLIPQLTS